MKKDSVRGWRDVFTFTLTQTLKSKAYIVSMVIMMVIAMVSMPIMNIFLSDGVAAGPEKSAVEKVYLYNMTLYRNLDFDSELSEGYQHIVFEPTIGDMNALETKILEEEQNSVILYLMEDEQYCYIQFLRSPDGNVTNYELQMLGQFIQNAYTKAKIQLLGLTEEQLTFFETSVVSSSSVVDTESALHITAFGSISFILTVQK